MICPECERDLIFINNRLVCPECGKAWNEILSEDTTCYDPKIAKTYNSIVAYEYGIIDDLLQNGQIYGLLFQIKDMYEVLIRIPVLLTAARLFSDNACGPKEREFQLFLLSKPLSLGDWRAALSLAAAAAAEAGMDDFPKSYIKKVKNFACSEKGGDIVFWRNETIAHGALKPLNDPEMYDDVAAKLRQLTDFLSKQADFFTELNFVTEDGKALVGNDLDFNALHGALYSVRAGKTTPLYPYFNISMQGIYFFDRYVARSGRTDIVEYLRSRKQSLLIPEFAALAQGGGEEVSASLEAASYTVEERKMCEKFLSECDYKEPAFLREWLEEMLESGDKVFMLRMQKGMGKSTFIRAIDPFAMGCTELPGTAVRAFYVNSTYNSRVDDFSVGVSDAMRQLGRSATAANNLPVLDIGADDPRKAFADFLNAYKKYHYTDRDILFVFDGIDEINVQPGRNVTDFIPRAEDLAEGVHVLVTCRTSDKSDSISNFCRNFVDAFPYPVKEVRADTPEYEAFSYDYFRAVMQRAAKMCGRKVATEFVPGEAEWREIYDSLPGHDLLTLALYRELALSDVSSKVEQNAERIEKADLMPGTDIYRAYFSRLSRLYGNRYYRKFLDLVAALSLIGRPLTLGELACLTGNDAPNFAFLGFVNSIRLFLSTTRSRRGALFSIAHLEQRRAIRSLFDDRIGEFIRRAVGRICLMAADKNFSLAERDDAAFLSLVGSIFAYRSARGEGEQNRELFLRLLSLPFRPTWMKSADEAENELDVLKSIFGYYAENADMPLSDLQFERVAYFITIMGLDNYLLSRFEQSEFYLSRAEGMYRGRYDRLSNEGKYHYTNCLGYYATYLGRVDRNEEALRIYTDSIAVTRELHENGSGLVSDVFWYSEMVCFSNVHAYCKKFADQYRLASEALQGLESLDESKRDKVWRKSVPFAHLSVANACRGLGRREEALEHYKTAKELYVACVDDKVPFFIPDAVLCFTARIELFAPCEKPAALAEMKELGDFIRRTEDEGALDNNDCRLRVFEVEMNAYQTMGMPEKAAETVREALRFVRERLSDEERAGEQFARYISAFKNAEASLCPSAAAGT